MCGIFGIIGDENVIDKCLNGLKKLEYRGYDSSGVAYIYDNKINIVKKIGKIANLEKELKNNISSKCAIMHTRWATHGAVTEVNAHPHTTKNKDVAIVHNGIIENYAELKQYYNLSCISQTDSEIIACLLDKCKKNSNLEKLKEVCSQLLGSYALAIIFANEPEKIYVAKNISPVVVGNSNGCSYVCSDANTLGEFCKSITVLEDNNFAVLTKDEITLFDFNLNKIDCVKINILNNYSNTKLLNFKHYMLKEIFDVPSAITETVNNNSNYNNLVNIFKKLKYNENTKFIFIGCGTAYHACLVGERLLNSINIEAHSYIASEFRYEKIKLDKNIIAIFISQSGETFDTLACIEKCKKQKIKTLAITNVRYSNITKLAHKVLYTYAGSEIAVASTKAYNSQLTILFLLKNFLKNYKNEQKNEIFYKNECKRIKKYSKYLLNQNLISKVKSLAHKYKRIKKFFLIGRLGDSITAKEGALKIKEITYNHCESYASGELKHGTIALIDKKSVVICFATNKKMLQKSFVALEEVACRGAKTILVTLNSVNIDESKFNEVIKINEVSSAYQELISIEVMQLFSYFLCVELKLDPDKPRNLAKSVTVE